ncbi:hypothetical protein PGB90_001822 [Kerria lacca]
MPGIVKVKVIEGRNLPVMDRSADTTDAYVELKLGSITYKSDVYRKSLNPQWNTEWYRFEMADADLQDEPLQIRVMDYDTYSANDLIGKVYFNLNPLLLNSTSEIRNILKSSGHITSPGLGCISGWFPIYDTIYGLRGEINIIIKLELFSDFNKFRQSSCGVHIFCCSMIPHGYYTENIFGLVEELVVEDDPEYQWIEKIRSPRASNEARQAIFYKMSGVLQRKIGMKVVEMGGNAIIGYRQCFDLEGETGGVVVRGIGTAVKLNRYKKLETTVIRNSFFNDFKFKIPNLTLTSTFGFNANLHDDVYSVLSLTNSLQSDKCLSDLTLDDRWSLCSFGSRTSTNSRYTSIETLLEQTNRKPILKSNSKFLNMARYFTSSKLRQKFSQKKKQKSILLRKFSIIEEYKRKSTNSLGEEVDDLKQEVNNFKENSEKNVNLKKNISERIPSVKERTSCIIFNNSKQNQSAYFNMTEDSSFENKNKLIFNCKECMKTNNNAADEKRISVENDKKLKISNNVCTKEPMECTISKCEPLESDEYFSRKNQQVYYHSYFTNNEEIIASQNKNDFEINSITENIDTVQKSKDNYDEGLNVSLKNTNTLFVNQGRSTPPISEMTPFFMSFCTDNSSSIKAITDNKNMFANIKSIKFEQNFLKSLLRKNINDYFTISSSPEIRRISLLNKSSKSELPEAENIVISQYGKETINSMDEFLSNPSNIDNSISESQVKCVSNVLNVDVKSTSQVDYSSKNCKFPCAPNRFNDYLYLNTNKTNCDVQITTADDNCNILSEALTPSRLLMHANNPDRNISEGEKEEELSKRENVKEGEHAIKNKSLSDTSSSVKGNERVKETSQEQDSVGSSYIIEYKGYNVIHKEHIELMEYPFFTLSNYPEHFIIHLGGTVSARSVKLLDRISNTEEPETRDTWWTELRIEIKSHMRALACNAVLNYMENTSICDEVCLLSASGTAALVKVYDGANSKQTDDTQKCMFNKNMDTEYENKIEKSTTEDASTMNCSIFHIPYRKSSLPFPVSIKVCEICKNGFVADVTFLTIEPLDKIPVIGQGAFIYAFVHRPKRDCRSELNAREISEGLPFLEYELNRQLINKLRIKGMNTLFGLNVHVSIGEKMIAAYATGTAMLLSALPVPPELSLMAHGKHFTQHPTSRKKLNEIRKLVEDMIKQNKIHYQLLEQQTICEILSKTSKQNANDDCTMQDQYSDMEYFAGSKQTCIIEVDDEDDLEIIAQLIDPNPPQGFFVSTTEKVSFGSFSYIPKRNIQLFAQVYRYRVPSSTPPSSFNKYFHRIVQALYMKIHHRIPCSLNKVSFKINIPEADELQIRIVGMALALKESEKALESVSTSCSSVSELADDFILNMDNEKDIEQGEIQNILTPMKHGSKKRNDIFDNEIHITSLSYIPGANINFYLGNLNFVFIRESTLVKEQPGGANNFVNNFLSDVTAVVKSHAAGIGGNAIVNFFLNECLLTTHSHKNQGQCLTHVGGDVVRYMYRNP